MILKSKRIQQMLNDSRQIIHKVDLPLKKLESSPEKAHFLQGTSEFANIGKLMLNIEDPLAQSELSLQFRES